MLCCRYLRFFSDPPGDLLPSSCSWSSLALLAALISFTTLSWALSTHSTCTHIVHSTPSLAHWPSHSHWATVDHTPSLSWSPEEAGCPHLDLWRAETGNLDLGDSITTNEKKQKHSVHSNNFRKTKLWKELTIEGVYLDLSAASSLFVFFANFFTGAREGDGLLLARRLLPPGLSVVFLTGCDAFLSWSWVCRSLTPWNQGELEGG